MVCDDELEQSPELRLLYEIGQRSEALDIASISGASGARFRIATDKTEIDFDFGGGRGERVFIYGDWWNRRPADEASSLGLRQEVLERRLLLAHHAARHDDVDGLVLPFDEELAERWRELWIKAPIVTIEEAVALCGLCMRAHGDFTIALEHNTVIQAEDEQFYRAGAAALLRGIATWLVASTKHWRSHGDPAQSALADAILVRMGRALKARDYLQVRRRAPNRDGAWADVLFFFEYVLLSLQGVLDSAARFLHLHYGLKRSRRAANWGREQWRTDLLQAGAPEKLFEDGRLIRLDVLVGELRNSIHGEVLSHELREPSDGDTDPTFLGYMRTGIALDRDLAAAIMPAAEVEFERSALAGTFPDGVALVDPWAYAESAIVSVARAIGDLVAMLNDSDFKDLEVPPKFAELWISSPSRQANAEMLLGVGNLRSA
jgi:hypothetical protein